MPRQLLGTAIAANTITTTQLTTTVVTQISAGGGPKVTNVQVANSTYSVMDDTAVDLVGGYIVITGTGFESGATVLIDNTTATSTTFVSSTQLRAQIPAKSAGTYNVYVVNPDGGVGMKVVGLTYSASPIWVTSSTLSNTTNATPFSTNLTATGANNYALASGSSLPPNTSLNVVSANAVFSGNIAVANDTQYTFTVNAIDTENQDSPRTFSLYTLVAMLRNLVGSGSFRTDPYSANLIGAWPMNVHKTNTDLSGNARNLTVTGTMTYPTIPDPANTVYQTASGGFTNSKYFSIAASTTGDLKSLSNLTLECWFYANTSPSQSEFTLVNFYSSQSEGGMKLNLTSKYANYSAYLGFAAQSTNNAFELGKWNHIAFVKSGTTYSIYINGTLNGTTTSSSTGSGYSSNQIGFSQYGGGGQSWSDGYIHDMRLYNIAKYSSNFDVATVAPILLS